VPTQAVAAAALGLGAHAAGIWAGASVHEVAQVVAAAGAIGGPALGVAVVVKLARVVMLAPVLAWVGWSRRRAGRITGAATGSAQGAPLVPGFVLGFCAMVLAATWLPLPGLAVHAGQTTGTVLLSAAMFALGSGVRLHALRRLGVRPLLLAAAATAWVGTLGLVGAVLVG
jgi:uncharacterized integral membrane protein (TIGR00698 family)